MINRNTTLKEILKIKGASEILLKHRVPCLTCPFADIEMDKLKLGKISKMYSIDIDKLLKELNKLTRQPDNQATN